MKKIICKIDLVRPYAFCKNESEKVFIPPTFLNDANNGDEVEVLVTKEKENDKLAEGEVLQILKKDKRMQIGKVVATTFSGSYIYSKSIPQDVLYKGKLQVNDVVLFKPEYNKKLSKFYTNKVKKIGKFSNFKTKEFIQIYESGLSLEYPNVFSKEEKEDKRVDLTNLLHITIDGADAKDLDDAIYLKKSKDYYTLYVSIADVSHYVVENSTLDLEALKRGNSTYLVTEVIPMLPKKLSNNLCSLNPMEEKKAFTVKMKINFSGDVVDFEIFKSTIISYKRFTYDKVNEIFFKNKKYDKIDYMLFDMHELYKILENKNIKKGALTFEDKELKFNKDLIPELRQRQDAEKLIEQFMILANQIVGNYLFYADIPSIYRVHDKPDQDKLKTVLDDIKVMKNTIHIPVTRDIKSYDIQNVINSLKNTEFEYLANKMLIQSMKKAKYDIENIGHFGLALNNYTHFTSPIRRYSDLVVHRYLNKVLNGKIYTEEEKSELRYKLDKISKQVSETELNSQKLEYSCIKLASMQYMEKIKKVSAIVSYIKKDKVYFETELGIEVVLYNKKQEKFILGKKFNLVIVDVNYEREEIEVKVDIRKK